jgi:hypothetical protein
VLTVGVSGHQQLRDECSWQWVGEQLTHIAKGFPRPWIGVSSLAIGADQLFAETVIAVGAQLKVVVPNETYQNSFAAGEELGRYLKLLGQASDVVALRGANSSEESYLAAGKTIVDQSDVLVAVWDGLPAKGLGGTGDIVAYAKALKKRIIHINPVSRCVGEM